MDKNEITKNLCSYFCPKLQNISAWRINMVSHKTLKDHVNPNIRFVQLIEVFNEQIEKGKRLDMIKPRQI